jgi:hypothetical protein
MPPSKAELAFIRDAVGGASEEDIAEVFKNQGGDVAATIDHLLTRFSEFFGRQGEREEEALSPSPPLSLLSLAPDGARAEPQAPRAPPAG